jgi:hypothetical protein
VLAKAGANSANTGGADAVPLPDQYSFLIWKHQSRFFWFLQTPIDFV